MSGVVIVDTDVVSFLFKGGHARPGVSPALAGQDTGSLVHDCAELYQWAYGRHWGKQKLARLEEQLRAYVVVPYDGELCRQWALICVERQRLGKPISVQDAWIAATAVRHGCPLITHNRDDFADIAGLTIVSEA